jgi:hypothetical protein
MLRHDCEKQQELRCISRVLRNELRNVETESIPPGNQSEDILIWSEDQQAWIAVNIPFLKSITNLQLGSGQDMLNITTTPNQNVIVASRTLVSGDGTISIAQDMNGQIDIRSLGGGTPDIINANTITSSTPTTLSTIPLLLTNTVYDLSIRAVASYVDGTIMGASFHIIAAYKLGITTVTLIGETTETINSDNTDLVVTLMAGISDVLIQVQGPSGISVNWKVVTSVINSNP